MKNVIQEIELNEYVFYNISNYLYYKFIGQILGVQIYGKKVKVTLITNEVIAMVIVWYNIMVK